MRPSEYLELGWCQRVLAKTKDEKSVSELNELAASWCMAGAMNVAQVRGNLSPTQRLEMAMKCDRLVNAEPGPYVSYVAWQDAPGRTQAEVVAMMKVAELAVLGEV